MKVLKIFKSLLYRITFLDLCSINSCQTMKWTVFVVSDGMMMT